MREQGLVTKAIHQVMAVHVFHKIRTRVPLTTTKDSFVDVPQLFKHTA